ncbi:hypothetical protein PQE75_gp104 [Bacillus phage vB_BcoS-136]|uniref:Uncharacterized protein n=1 Tax=Bacillus phage vB_BcoS-136 TaxID=2419619 RepID=A0A3G3BVY6_9CAUD|nr:hypothetical protein PQE75_gp104 [Bacillus phage vB_BcoS-136]AYP68236.1 hypothetical protein vBBcoS136_00104 [Bacillus phage vB_BcoS-136]
MLKERIFKLSRILSNKKIRKNVVYKALIINERENYNEDSTTQWAEKHLG